MLLTCRGCGAAVDALGPSPWACPQRGPDGVAGDIDHVLVLPPPPVLCAGTVAGATIPTHRTGGRGEQRDPNPFLRYRERLGSYAAAIEAGWTDERFVDAVSSLDDAVADVWGSGFRVTPVTREIALGAAVGIDHLVVKDETNNVSGSHKGRHLFGLAIWMILRGDDPSTRLAIASCGNAALAAATIAAAMRRPLDVFVPMWADEVVVTTLRDLGATIVRCERRDGEVGDPCVLRMRESVAAGALPFGCQGPDNGLTIDGGRTIGWELAEQAPDVTNVFVQVGGGALGSALALGMLDAGARPRLFAVQAEGCAPFPEAWLHVFYTGLESCVRRRSEVMRPWPTEPHSAATGILDDETYDWAALSEAISDLRGSAAGVPEWSIVHAHELARELTSVDVDPTGSAGLAGAVEHHARNNVMQGSAAVLFTGVTRR